jgi:hypothetical protein
MAEQTAPKTPTKEDLLLKLDALDAKAKENAGKDGHNPFIWVAENTSPLRAELHSSDKLDLAKIASSINALKVDTRV